MAIALTNSRRILNLFKKKINKKSKHLEVKLNRIIGLKLKLETINLNKNKNEINKDRIWDVGVF